MTISVTEADIEELESSLSRLRSIFRYELLKNFQIVHFLNKNLGEIKELADLSIEQLAERGGKGICEERNLSPQIVSALVQVIENLVVGSPSEELSYDDSWEFDHSDPFRNSQRDEELFAAQQRRETSRFGQPPVLGSIEAHQRLEEAFSKVRSSPAFSRFCELTLGEYWDQSGVRDPFLEAINFRQIIEIKIETLFEKRSFTPRKVVAVQKAIENCLAAYGEASVQREIKPDVAMPISAAACPWQPCERQYPLFAGELVSAFEAEWGRSQVYGGWLGKIIHNIPNRLSRTEFVVATISGQSTPAAASKLLGLTKKDFQSILDRALKQLRALSDEFAPAVVKQWSALATVKGVSDDVLFDPYLSATGRAEFQKGLLKTLYSACRKPENAAKTVGK